jgi:hypothetical protein
MSKHIRNIRSLAFTALFVAVGATNAYAGFSAVKAPPASEAGHAQILSQTYGATFSANGLNFTGGSMTATRLEDSSGYAAMDMLAGDASTGGDECWSNGVLSIRAIARFAGYEQKLGVVDGAGGAGSFQELFTVSGYGTDVSGSIVGLDVCGKTFRFARGGGGEMFSSLAADNFASFDQMVSYKLSGAGAIKFVLFFEDGNDAGCDWDYNDLVVEITALAPINAIPLPPSMWSGLVLLLTGGLWNARAALRRWFS